MRWVKSFLKVTILKSGRRANGDRKHVALLHWLLYFYVCYIAYSYVSQILRVIFSILNDQL